MQYALLAYGHQNTRDAARPIDSATAAVLARPYVTGWARLHADESATTVCSGDAGTLLTDGPFMVSGNCVPVARSIISELLTLIKMACASGRAYASEGYGATGTE